MPRKELTAEQKAEALLAAGRVRQDEEYPNIWWVDSPNHPEPYRVQLFYAHDALTTCTCQHGLHKVPASCYHALAVRMLYERGSDGTEKEENRG